MQIPDSFPGNLQYPEIINRVYFEEVKQEENKTSIRIHKRKGGGVSKQGLEEIPWCQEGYYLEERPLFTLDPLFHTGAYYVQDAGSMLLRWVLDQLPFQDKSELKILDLCAAPGGKSTLIAEWLDGRGALHANEVIQSRAQILSKNLSKCGYSNILITQLDPKDLGKLEQSYDVIVVDAPCSGEGMWRKDPKSIKEWSPDHVALCDARQKRILSDIYPALAPEGYLIYATCAYNHHENIDQVIQLSKSKPLKSIPLNPPTNWNLLNIEKENCFGIQSLPGMSKGEGLFISILKNESQSIKKSKRTSKDHYLSRKQIELVSSYIEQKACDFPTIITKADVLYLIPPKVLELYQEINKKHKVVRTGLLAGKLTERLFIPSHELALSLQLRKEVESFELNKEEALYFLRKSLTKIDHPKKGWMTMNYKNLPLAWVKNLGNRINNYLPKGDVIRMK